MMVAWKPTTMTRKQSIRATKGQHLLIIFTDTYPHTDKVQRHLQILLRFQEKVFEENLSATERDQKLDR